MSFDKIVLSPIKKLINWILYPLDLIFSGLLGIGIF